MYAPSSGSKQCKISMRDKRQRLQRRQSDAKRDLTTAINFIKIIFCFRINYEIEDDVQLTISRWNESLEIETVSWTLKQQVESFN